MIRYREDLFKLPAIRIVAGEYAVSAEDAVLATLLGSCVAVCLRDPIAGVAGMNHFMLPSNDGAGKRNDLSYGSSSMLRLVDEMVRQGADPAALQAKVFGAGDVTEPNTKVGVGKMNAEFALAYLRANDIQILAADLRGTRARKLFFIVRTGQVFVRYLRESFVERTA